MFEELTLLACSLLIMALQASSRRSSRGLAPSAGEAVGSDSVHEVDITAVVALAALLDGEQPMG